MKAKKRKCFFTLLFLVCIFLVGCYPKEVKPAKPVIYLYPTVEQEVAVKLDYQGEVLVTYPEYKDGWKVTAKPDGTLINKEDGKEYSYLFWEGKSKDKWDMSKGFVVKGEDTKDFLQETLAKMGLTPKEYNEFIVYWLPRMQDNKYNLISFSKEEYEERAKLQVTPRPDSILRVFMVFKPLKKAIIVEPQEINAFERKSFTLVEWGGAEVE